MIYEQPRFLRATATFKDFTAARPLPCLWEEVPRNWRRYCDHVTHNFRIINPADFRFLA